MAVLLLSTWSLPAAPALAGAARKASWQVRVYDEGPPLAVNDQVVFYGGTDVARAVAAKWHLALLEPPLDLLTCLPWTFRQRALAYRRFKELDGLQFPTFVKPADPLNKVFDAGIYTDVRDLQRGRCVPHDTPVLVAEPVEWLAEYRCFILDGKVVASSPYLSFGRPIWRPYDQAGSRAAASNHVLAFCERLCASSALTLPPAFVVDVGLIEDRAWAVVEFNPAWCSGLLGADPARVLTVLRRACQDAETLRREDRRWVLARP
jgi:hypothetical protein